MRSCAPLLLASLLVACGAPAGDRPDADGPPAGDAAPADAAPDPLAHCPAPAPLPAWAEAAGDAALTARCAAHTLHVAALADGIVRLRYARPDDPRGPAGTATSWAVAEAPAPAPQIRLSGGPERAIVCTPEARVTIDAACLATVADAAGRVLAEDVALDVAAAGRTTLRRRAPAGERYYGLGEKTGPLDRRGRRLTFWNTDAYDPSRGGYRPDQDPLYLSIPMFHALRDGLAHGVFTDFAGRAVLDLAAATPDAYAVEVDADALDQYVYLGPRLADVTRRHAALTGRIALPPRWALGFHQSRWGYAPAAQLDELAARFRAERIPADALWLDIQHLDGYRTFTWDPTAFPEPEALIARLAAHGFAAVAIADPGIKVDPAWDVYAGGVAGDHFLRTPAGAIYEGVAWPGASAFPDFTRAATRAWWAGHVGGMAARGLRGVWLDVNEPTIFPEADGDEIPLDLPVASDGHDDGRAATLGDVHNAYALAEARATVDGLRAAAPDRRPFVLSRAGYAGIQRHAAVWTGDVVSDWDGLRGTLPMLLGMGVSGVPLVGSDVGGYSGGATPELYARWMALGSISPLFRAHVTSGVPGQEPWQFGTEVRDVSRALIEARYRLLPTWYSLVHEAHATGAPILRPLVYEFQDDPATHTIDDQAMLGPWLLVAPVVEPGATTRSVYLPAGRWFEVASGAAYDGPATIEVSVTTAALPMFARAGAIVAHGPVMQHTGEAPLAPLALDLYPGAPGDAPSTFDLYEDAGDGDGPGAITRYTLAATATGARLTIAARAGAYAPPPRRLTIRLRRADGEVTGVAVDGVALPPRAPGAADGTGWSADPDDRAIVVALDDLAGATLDFTYDRAIAELRPAVAVTLEVRVPDGTPADPPVHVATSANGWTHQPLAWTDEPGVARGTVLVPRGEWFFYKYTRGSWDTVEKWPDCAEASNRYRFGAATARQADTVYRWRDGCP